MPCTVKLSGVDWKCRCGAKNEVLYVQCSECDEEYEVVGDAPADKGSRQARRTTANTARQVSDAYTQIAEVVTYIEYRLPSRNFESVLTHVLGTLRQLLPC